MSLFLAVWPDGPTVARLAHLDRPVRPGLRWTDPAHWHVTLAFLGDADAGAAGAALSELEAAAPAEVAVTLGPATRVLNRTVLMAPASGLDQLAVTVQAACRSQGLELEDRAFRGHLTLARGRRPGDLAGLAGQPVEATFPARGVDLVQSTPVPGGGPNRYEVLGRLSLSTHRV